MHIRINYTIPINKFFLMIPSKTVKKLMNVVPHVDVITYLKDEYVSFSNDFINLNIEIVVTI